MSVKPPQTYWARTALQAAPDANTYAGYTPERASAAAFDICRAAIETQEFGNAGLHLQALAVIIKPPVPSPIP